MRTVPIPETFGLVPSGSDLVLYLLFVPFAAALIIRLRRCLPDIRLRRLATLAPGSAGAIIRIAHHVLLQWRVAQHPRGWPHLAIFFGFLGLLAATSLVAVDWTLARISGTHFLSGAFYLRFESLVDAFSLLFVAGLLIALIRRLVNLRRTEPAQRRIQRLFILNIAGLLYLGLTGFLLEGLRLVIHPVPWAGWSFVGVRLAHALGAFGVGPSAQPFYVVLWWSHALVAFLLISLLPYGPLLHAVAAPLNIMMTQDKPHLEPRVPFDLRSVLASGDFDLKVGLSSIGDLQGAERCALLACTSCGRCEAVCPAVAIGTALSPRKLVQTLREQILVKTPLKDLLATSVVSAAEVWACTTCAACVMVCPVLIHPVDYIIPFRRELVSRQLLEKRHLELLDALHRCANPYGLPTASRNRLAADLEPMHILKHQEQQQCVK
ncbi:MAG: (Fe-S)-binding protein [Gammaproteobacteria bacterium]|nr:(Fe-S)-binding protein [Gammaproteobacteria bacterium]